MMFVGLILDFIAVGYGAYFQPPIADDVCWPHPRLHRLDRCALRHGEIAPRMEVVIFVLLFN